VLNHWPYDQRELWILVNYLMLVTSQKIRKSMIEADRLSIISWSRRQPCKFDSSTDAIYLLLGLLQKPHSDFKLQVSPRVQPESPKNKKLRNPLVISADTWQCSPHSSCAISEIDPRLTYKARSLDSKWFGHTKTDATQWSLLLETFTTLDYVWKGSSTVRHLSRPLLKQSISSRPRTLFWHIRLVFANEMPWKEEE
jgi:hypothetical protein